MADHKFKTTNPQGMVVVWNYKDRITSDGAKDPNEIEQIILNTASLVSIDTQKTKSQPQGSFEFELAPTFNWVGRITPGSWCAILMSQDEFIPPTSNKFPGFANKNTLKMLGRIHSTRVVSDVDQITGARSTRYVVTGEDWGSVFNTTLYIDPIARNNTYDKFTAAGHAARLLFDKQILEWLDNKNAQLPTSSQVIDAIKKLWGAPLSDLQSSLDAIDNLNNGSNPLEPQLHLTSGSQFLLPREVAQFLKIKSLSSVNLASTIKLVDGVLKADDNYSGDTKEAFGFPNPMSFYGNNSFWQLMVDNSNPILNEMLTDIRWDGDNPVLALYKRVKPFAYRDTFIGSEESGVKENISMFKNIRKVDIELEDILSINAGTNWNDKVNFIEVKPQPQLNQVNFDAQVKADSQSVDLKAYERDGFKPMIQKADYMPYNGSEPAPLKAVKWKHLLREWHFNTHNLLNGAVSFMGQNDYIQVGDNIKLPAKVLGSGAFNSGQAELSIDDTYLLAHVESVQHNFTVTDIGARSFTSSVQFVRGVIVDSNNNVIADIDSGSTGNQALDQDATEVNGVPEKNNNVLGTSSDGDPDIDKLKGE